MAALLTLAMASVPNHSIPRDALVVRGVVVSAITTDAQRGPTTTYEVAVEEVLQGVAPTHVQLTLPGGTISGRHMALGNIPVWSIGDDVVATLLSDTSAPSWGQYTVHGETLQPARDGGPHTVAALEEQLQSVHR